MKFQGGNNKIIPLRAPANKITLRKSFFCHEHGSTFLVVCSQNPVKMLFPIPFSTKMKWKSGRKWQFWITQNIWKPPTTLISHLNRVNWFKPIIWDFLKSCEVTLLATSSKSVQILFLDPSNSCVSRQKCPNCSVDKPIFKSKLFQQNHSNSSNMRFIIIFGHFAGHFRRT